MMYRSIFQNSKAALVFAAMTIIGAIMMVGSDENGGVLSTTVDRFSQQREAFIEEAHDYAEAQSVSDDVIDPAAGWGSSSSNAMFGDYLAEDPADDIVDNAKPARSATSPAKGQALARGPQPVVSDSEGIAVPDSDDQPSQASPPPVAIITSRQMTIEPQ